MFPTFPLFEGVVGDPPQVLLATYNYNISAINDAGSGYAAIKAAGYHCDGASIGGLLADDTLIITVNMSGTFIAWSPWGLPAITVANSGSYWQFAVVRPDNTVSIIHAMSRQDGYVAARAVALADEPFYLTGDTEYWFGISDTPTVDNSGGVSITVQVWGNR